MKNVISLFVIYTVLSAIYPSVQSETNTFCITKTGKRLCYPKQFARYGLLLGTNTTDHVACLHTFETMKQYQEQIEHSQELSLTNGITIAVCVGERRNFPNTAGVPIFRDFTYGPDGRLLRISPIYEALDR